MTPKKLMEYLIDSGFSKYKIAKVMRMHPIMVDNLLTEKVKTIRKEAATNLKTKFDVEVEDRYINGMERKQLTFNF